MILITCPIYLCILVFTLLIITRNWKKSIRNEFQNDDELTKWVILLGVLFTSLAPLIGFIRFDDFGPDLPFSKNHVLAIELIVVVSAICYWVSKFFKKKLPPFVNLLLRAGLIQGIILDFIITIHFANYLGLGLMFPFFGFELLAPPIAMLFLLFELHCNFRTPKQTTEPILSVQKEIPLQFGVVIALVVVEQMMLFPMGFQWNSIVLAFTESKGFVFSLDSRFNF